MRKTQIIWVYLAKMSRQIKVPLRYTYLSDESEDSDMRCEHENVQIFIR